MDKKFLELVRKYLKSDLVDINMDLKEYGLDSMLSIELLLEIETEYNFIFPDEFLIPDTFTSAQNLWDVIQSLTMVERK